MQRLPMTSKKRDLVLGAILVAAVVLAYVPVWSAGFIWDDDINLTANPCIVGPLGLKEIWTTGAAQFYPLVLTTFWVEHALWGLWPLPYHLVNVFLHVGCAIVLWQVLRKLLVPGAWFGAALWALHPVQVESVAWISELKNTQSGLFYLLSILFFVRHLRSPNAAKPISRDWDYGLTLLFAILAIASKSSTVILPVVLCLCAWWVEGRWHWRNLIKIAPIVPISIAASALTLWTQVMSRESHSVSDPRLHTWPAHLVGAGEGFWFYLGKLVWPHPLIALYPQLEVKTNEPLSYLPFLAVVVLLFVLWRQRNSWGRPWFFAFAYFLIAMLPELEFAGWYIGDHFQYLGSMGPLALAGAGLATFPKKVLQIVLGVILTLSLAFLTFRQACIDRNSASLWTYTLSWNDAAWLGHNNLGLVLLDAGQYDRALAEFQKSCELCPVFVGARSNVGLTYFKLGQIERAVTNYRTATEMDPQDKGAHDGLGTALAQKGDSDGAIAEFRRAAELNPMDFDPENRLGNELQEKGRPDEAMAAFREAIARAPHLAELHFNLGNALDKAARFGEAADEYRKAIELKPANADAHNGLGIALAQQGDVAGAVAEFQKALQVQPELATAEKNLAQAQAILQKGTKP
jgi:Flp pilus assembly protein TadD